MICLLGFRVVVQAAWVTGALVNGRASRNAPAKLHLFNPADGTHLTL
jgi:hypothetical protein